MSSIFHAKNEILFSIVKLKSSLVYKTYHAIASKFVVTTAHQPDALMKIAVFVCLNFFEHLRNAAHYSCNIRASLWRHHCWVMEFCAQRRPDVLTAHCRVWRTCAVLSMVCCWTMYLTSDSRWAVTYIAQLNPLVVPERAWGEAAHSGGHAALL